VAKKALTFDAIRRIGRTLPDVEEGTAWGVPALKVGGKMIACMASHKSAEPNTLIVMMSFDQREALLAEQPEIYYLKDHYVGYPCVLVRLGKVPQDALRDLLLMAHRFVAARARVSRRTGRGKAPTARRRQKR
jgi:hypothetical protein